MVLGTWNIRLGLTSWYRVLTGFGHLWGWGLCRYVPVVLMSGIATADMLIEASIRRAK